MPGCPLFTAASHSRSCLGRRSDVPGGQIKKEEDCIAGHL